MRVLDAGHRFACKNNKDEGETTLTFYKDESINGDGYAGTTNQEVARALISRILFLDDQVPWGGNYELIDELRNFIIFHEVRAAMRHGLCDLDAWRQLHHMNRVHGGIENVPLRSDGHIYPEETLHKNCDGDCRRPGDPQEEFE